MDLATILGVVSGIVFIFLSIALGANFNISMMASAFLSGSSVMITVGGTIASTFIAYPFNKLAGAFKGMKVIYFPPKLNPMDVIKKIIDLSTLARKEGVLALDDLTASMDDPFLEKGIKLIVDATDPELVRSILETEMSYIENRHADARSVWEFIGSQAPAWGMIGTLIGLVLMLKDMGDVSSIGPAMALALITTLYGSVLANFVANPIANKMKVYSAEEMLIKEVQIEGMLSIQAGENPRVIEEKLKAFLSPALRSDGGDGRRREEAGE